MKSGPEILPQNFSKPCLQGAGYKVSFFNMRAEGSTAGHVPLYVYVFPNTPYGPTGKIHPYVNMCAAPTTSLATMRDRASRHAPNTDHEDPRSSIRCVYRILEGAHRFVCHYVQLCARRAGSLSVLCARIMNMSKPTTVSRAKEP